MSGAEVLYTDVKFERKKKNTNDTACSSTDTTYSEVKILKTELPGPQQAVSNERSKVRSEKVTLVLLSVLLAVVFIAFCYFFYDNIRTKKKYETLKAEYEALRTNFSETLSAPVSEIKPDASCVKCDKDWQQHGGKCYFFSINKIPWEWSKNLCRRIGGDLVKIDSEEEQMFLENELRSKMNEDEDKFWIGLTDSKEENKWIWVDGSPLNTSLSFWSEGEPDNYEGENINGEDCVRMGEKGGTKDWKIWHDRSCNVSHRCICEKQAETGRRTCS
ncbi:hypothetical protein PAMA_011862 [Pampus argenteus]